jgi:peptidoglycan/xylan/chitin deacetylase (PgdA/CDA1 family)
LNSKFDWITRPPELLRMFYPSVLWRVKNAGTKVFLTFDDGPVPGVTPWVMGQLKAFDAKGTFFCVGDNIRKYPGIYNHLLEEGFETGTHSYSHTPGHRFGIKEFLKDISRGLEYSREVRWFRPPHGILLPWWVPQIRKEGVRVVMWDVLSRDYDRSLLPSRVIKNVVENIRPGSVVVFHDSLKAWPNLKIALPAVLSWIKENGYTTAFLSSINQNKRL